MRRHSLIPVIVLSLALSAGEKDRPAPDLADLIEKIDAKSEQVSTLRARFIQKREVSLLMDSPEMTGVFCLQRPYGMRFDFDEEHDLLVILNKNHMVTISHKTKTASRIKIKKRLGRFMQRLLSDKMGSLLGNFEVTLEQKDEAKGYRLKLVPTKRKLKKKFTNIEMWVNAEYMLTRLKVTLKDGDVYDLQLQNIEINVEIAPNFFDATIPESYQLGERTDFIFGAGETF